MIVLYSTDCPKCNALKKRLTKNGIKFEVSQDVDELIKRGYQSIPVLKIHDKFFDYNQSMNILKNYEKGIITGEEFGGLK